MRLRSVILIIAAFALGLAAMRWWHRLDADDPRPPRFVVLYLTADGTPRVYGPAGGRRARLARGVVGGRVVECVGLP